MPPRRAQRPSPKKYVNYEIEARERRSPRAFTRLQKQQISRASEVTWNALPLIHRNNFIAHIDHAVATESNVKELRASIDRCDTELTRKLGREARTQDWATVIQECARQTGEYNIWIERQQILCEALIQLRQTVRTVYANDYVRHHALSKETEALAELIRMRRRRQFFVDHAEHPGLPQRDDGKLKIVEEWLPRWKRVEARGWDVNRALAGFPADREDPPYLGPEWVGGWLRPAGGMSTNNLWIEFDGNNAVRDRVFEKVVYKSRREWRDAIYWDDWHDPSKRELIEIACHDLYDVPFNRVRNKVNVPRLRRADRRDQSFKYTMYLNYYGFGDLHDLLVRHYRAPPEPSIPIPEPFLWRLFHSLAIVGLAMQRGFVENEHEYRPVEAWKEIVHRDIKPANVFLDYTEPGDGFFETYPRPILGDFGLAIKTTSDDCFNPSLFVGAGTRGFLPPEQIAYVEYDTMEPLDAFKLSFKTNVWGAGIIVYTIATLSDGAPDELLWLGNGWDDPAQPTMASSDLAHHYSDDLKNLIDSCLSWDPARRPGFQEILFEVDNAIENNLTQGKRRKRIGEDEEEEGAGPELIWRRDRYAIGLTMDVLPERPPTPE